VDGTLSGEALMKKLQLDLDKLVVEAFEVDTPPEEHGTVEGQNLPCTHPQVCPASENWYCTGVCNCTRYAQYCLA
jgi:hypothetical protein